MCYLSACVQVTLILLNNGPRAIHITSIIVYCYNYSTLLLATIVNLLMCLTYTLNCIIGMDVVPFVFFRLPYLGAVLIKLLSFLSLNFTTREKCTLSESHDCFRTEG